MLYIRMCVNSSVFKCVLQAELMSHANSPTRQEKAARDERWQLVMKKQGTVEITMVQLKGNLMPTHRWQAT